jgi:hypothetical protein
VLHDINIFSNLFGNGLIFGSADALVVPVRLTQRQHAYSNLQCDVEHLSLRVPVCISLGLEESHCISLFVSDAFGLEQPLWLFSALVIRHFYHTFLSHCQRQGHRDHVADDIPHRERKHAVPRGLHLPRL